MQEEIALLLDRIPTDFDSHLRSHRCRSFPSLSFFVAGAGLSRRRELRRVLRELQPEVIVNMGLVGLLEEKDPLPVGGRLVIGEVTEVERGIVYPGGPGRDRLATVSAPLFEPWQKYELHLNSGARACDMEAARLLHLVGQSEIAERCWVVFCKTVGERVPDWPLYRDEEQLRRWRRMGFWEQLRIGLRFPGGPLQLRRLLAAKGMALTALTDRSEELLRRLLARGGPGPWTDSLFVAH